MNQRQFIHKYIEETADKFNKTLFSRSDDKIIDSIENIILSCEREGLITIKVVKFTVLDNYMDIRNKLRNYRDAELSKKSGAKSKGVQDNQYAYINLKDSDIKLLIVTYFVSAKGESTTFDVLIAVPRVVNKFYFRLNGCLYSSTYQIVDASTYNTSTSKSSSKHFITLKVIFQPIRIFRNINPIKTVDDQTLMCTTYDNNTFKKSVPVVQYMFAKYGFYKALNFLGIYGSIALSDGVDGATRQIFPNQYTIRAKKNANLYIHVNADLFDKVPIIQHVVYVLYSMVGKSDKYDDIFTDEYWVNALGCLFNSSISTLEKGTNILSSLELIYDVGTKLEIHLPEEYKHDIYHILRWMLWQYNDLRVKDNLNILTKKLKSDDYIAAIYATRLSRNVYRLSDKAKDADLKMIKSHLNIPPMFIINKMCKDQLIAFRGISTDMDSLLANKFTYKGESGIKTISSAYKLIHPSNLGILDPDASSPSDPGTSGTIVPTVKLYGNNYFSDFQEPLTFEDDYSSLFKTAQEASGLIEVYDMKKKLLADRKIDNDAKIEAEKTAASIRQMIKTVGLPEYFENNGDPVGIPLEGSGTIQYV